MSYTINSTEDVYKYAQVLFDYLNMHGEKKLAESLVDSVDGCFSSSEQALAAHKQALKQISSAAADLPPEHLQAVHRSLEILSHT